MAASWRTGRSTCCQKNGRDPLDDRRVVRALLVLGGAVMEVDCKAPRPGRLHHFIEEHGATYEQVDTAAWATRGHVQADGHAVSIERLFENKLRRVVAGEDLSRCT